MYYRENIRIYGMREVIKGNFYLSHGYLIFRFIKNLQIIFRKLLEKKSEKATLNIRCLIDINWGILKTVKYNFVSIICGKK